MTRLVHFPFPLRPDVTAEIVAPPDMTTEEAERLARYVRTLAVDGEEGTVAGLDLGALRRLEVETRGHDLLSGAETDLILIQLPAILAALERVPDLERRLRSTKAENERLRKELQRGYDPAAETISAQERRIAAQRTELAELEAEVRRLVSVGRYAGHEAITPRSFAGWAPEELPRIAALLREPAGPGR
jgi:hypothetical protein